LFAYIAKDYVNHENVLHFQPGLEPVQVRLLADQIAGACSGFCAVFTDSGSYCLATRSGDLRQLNKEMTLALSGRGGGKPNFQQGSL
jgi:alanyl-tRNA synthetase